jgi:glycosyltransferase involved in cell wall biosynthesis
MALAFVVSGRLDQLTGGYLYDHQVVEGLRARGHAVEVIELPGRYPDADADSREAAAHALAQLPDDYAVVIDGLALPGLAGALPRHARRLTLVGFIHHPLSLETGLSAEEARHYAQLEAELWPLLTGAICPSEHTARAVRASGLATDRVAVVPPGVRLPEHQATPPTVPHAAATDGRLQLLAVGTITPRKGHALLVDALARLHQQQPELDWCLTCIGSLDRDPAAAQALRQRIADHGLTERITLRGEQPAAQLTAAYQHADLFVLPSHHEGYGMVFTEALAHGLPIISTTAGAIPDTVPASASLLVPPGDEAALRHALARALSDPTLRAKLAAGACHAALSLHDWDAAVGRWVVAFDQVSR